MAQNEIKENVPYICKRTNRKYMLLLSKSEVSKLYKLVIENKKSLTPLRVRNRLLDLYLEANNIKCQGV